MDQILGSRVRISEETVYTLLRRARPPDARQSVCDHDGGAHRAAGVGPSVRAVRGICLELFKHLLNLSISSSCF